MFDEYVVSRPELNVKFGRDDFRIMVPFGGARPHFLKPPRRVGGQPRTADVFNNLKGPQDIAQFDPEAFRQGGEVHFMLMVKAPGQVTHKVPNLHMPQVSYLALQTAMDYQALTQGEDNLRRSWAKLEFMRRWVEPFEPAHPGTGDFKPVLNHTDEGPQRYKDKVGVVSSNFGLGTDIVTRHVRNPFDEQVTSDNIMSQFDYMRRQREYDTRPSGRLLGWGGDHPHAAGENLSDEPVLRTFMWLSYTDGQGEDREINTLARKNPVLFMK